MTIYVDSSVYYEAAAETWANHFGCAFNERCFGLLPALFEVSQQTLDDIECDFQAFADRVNDYLAATARAKEESI